MTVTKKNLFGSQKINKFGDSYTERMQCEQTK